MRESEEGECWLRYWLKPQGKDHAGRLQTLSMVYLLPRTSNLELALSQDFEMTILQRIRLTSFSSRLSSVRQHSFQTENL